MHKWDNVEMLKLLLGKLKACKINPSCITEYDGPALQKYWNKTQNLSVYGKSEYLGELWYCWKNYSRKYLMEIQRPNSQSTGTSIHKDICDTGVKHILDLGCGFGLTTRALADLFPTAKVTGTNLDTIQIKVAKLLANDRFSIVCDTSAIQSADLVFASEYFEHFLDPVAELQKILALEPKMLLVANAFNTEGVGHFQKYFIGKSPVSAEKISKLFNAILYAAGYVKTKTKMWNNRPTYWKKQKTNLPLFGE